MKILTKTKKAFTVELESLMLTKKYTYKPRARAVHIYMRHLLHTIYATVPTSTLKNIMCKKYLKKIKK